MLLFYGIKPLDTVSPKVFLMDNPIKVLLIEDNQAEARLVHEELSGGMDIFFNVVTENTLEHGLSQINNGNFDVILCDLNLPDSNGIDTFKSVFNKSNGVPIIILSGIKDENLALSAVKLGAQDYIPKDEVSEAILKRAIKYAIERQKVYKELEKYKKELDKYNNK